MEHANDTVWKIRAAHQMIVHMLCRVTLYAENRALHKTSTPTGMLCGHSGQTKRMCDYTDLKVICDDAVPSICGVGVL